MKSGRTPLFRSLMRAMQQASPAVSHKTRRDFLRIAGATGVAALTGMSHARGRHKLSGPVAIVGGGIAGLTTAYRLMKAGVEVHLYEMQNRFGGRMFTKRNFNKDGMFVELGGELVDSNHKDLIKLARELDVPLQSLRKGEKGLDYYYFNGKIYTDHDIIPAIAPLMEKIGSDAEDLYDKEDAFTDKARKLDQISLKDYLKATGAGVPAWVMEMIETAYVPEFGLDAHRQSCLNMVDFINPDTRHGFEIFGDSDEALRIKGGNDTLPTVVFEAIKNRVTIRSEHRLVGISATGTTGHKLTFSHKGKPFTASYDHVIMAIPFTILRDVDGVDHLKLSPEKMRAIRKMGYGTNIKIMAGFTDRTWRQPRDGGKVFCNGSVYTDKSFQTCWETSRGQKGVSGIITNFMGGSPAANYEPDYLDNLLREGNGLFPGFKSKFDGNKAVMNWPQISTIKASYSSPLVGQYTWVYQAAAAPECGGRLLFAGEHTSFESPGYMNGGVESGNRAADELLSLE
ncbi:NAD(P)/FAD-dependent oxidoreductase [soil metagenome]